MGASGPLLAAARRFRILVALLRASVVLVPVGLAVALWLVSGSVWVGPVGLVALLVATAIPALVNGLWAAPTEQEVGSKLNLVGQPGLYQCMAALAAEMDVRPPSAIRLVPDPVVAVRLRPTLPVLYIGAPLFWHLDLDEFERMVAREMSLLRCLRGDRLRRTWQRVDSVDVSAIRRRENLVNRIVLRPVAALVTRAADGLHATARTYADAGVPQRLLPRRSDEATMQEAAQAWATLCEKWVRPALRRRSSVTNLLAASKHVNEAYQNDQRDSAVARVPALSLLSEPERIDADFSQWLWHEWGCEGAPMTWDDYPRQVAVSHWREAAFAGACRYLGQPAALLVPTIDEMFSAITDECAKEDLPSERPLVDAVVRNGLLGARDVSLTWDWLAGVVFRDADGRVVDVDAAVDAAVGDASLEQLRWWLNGAGVDVTQPLYQPAPRPSAVVSAFDEVDRAMSQVDERHQVRTA